MPDNKSMDYLQLPEFSFKKEVERGDITSDRLVFLSGHIFDFCTYDDDISREFGQLAIDVCEAINTATTLDYTQNPLQYRIFLLMCNMPFFASRINWGMSIRGAWWDRRNHCIKSCGIWKAGKDQDEQILNLKFTYGEWKLFIDAVIKFASIKECVK